MVSGSHVAGQRDLRNRQSEEAQSIRSLRAHLASGQHPEGEKKKKNERRKRNNYTFTLFGVRFQKGETSQELHQWERVLGRKGVCYLFLIDNLKNILRSNIIILPPSLFSLEVLPYIPPLLALSQICGLSSTTYLAYIILLV